MGCCASQKMPDNELCPDTFDLRLGTIEHDMRIMQQNMQALHEHLETLTGELRTETRQTQHFFQDLAASPMNAQQKLHARQVQESLEKVAHILNLDATPS